MPYSVMNAVTYSWGVTYLSSVLWYLYSSKTGHISGLPPYFFCSSMVCLPPVTACFIFLVASSPVSFRLISEAGTEEECKGGVRMCGACKIEAAENISGMLKTLAEKKDESLGKLDDYLIKRSS